MGELDTSLIYLEERRLARHLRSAALHHIRKEFSEARLELFEGIDCITFNEKLCERTHALAFLREWLRAVEREEAGEFVMIAPAAWIHLGQEIADLMEWNPRAWESYLAERWRFQEQTLPWFRRASFALAALISGLSGVSVLAFFTYFLTIGPSSRLLPNPIVGWSDGVAAFLRLAAWILFAGLLVECGRVWLLRAARGKCKDGKAEFLLQKDGLSLIPPEL